MKQSLYFKAFTVIDGEYNKAMFLFPRLVPEEDIEGVMYDVALMALDENEDHVDAFVVVAYDANTHLAQYASIYGQEYREIVHDEYGFEMLIMDVSTMGHDLPTALVIDK